MSLSPRITFVIIKVTLYHLRNKLRSAVLLGLCAVKKLSVLQTSRNKICVTSSTVEQSKKTAWLLKT